MAPLRRKKGASPVSPTRISPARNSQFSPSRSAAVKTPMKSPLRQVRHSGITKSQKAVILENLNLEITERAKKLRAQYLMQARSLKQRIEMRINRVPKKLWGATMGELLAQAGPAAIGNMSGSMSTKLNTVAVKGFVEDVKRLSGSEQEESPQAARLVVPKKRTTKKIASVSAREQMPPPPVPAAAAASTSHPLALSPSKSSLPPSSSSPNYLTSSSPTRPTTKAPTKVITKTTTKPLARTIRKIVPSGQSVASNSSRPSSRATTRSSLETAATSSGSGHETGTRGTKVSQTKTKTTVAITTTSSNSGLKRGGVKGVGSNGSLKENRVEGVKEKAASTKTTKKDTTTAANGGRVLRSRK